MPEASIAGHAMERSPGFGKVIFTDMPAGHFQRLRREARPVLTHPSAVTIQPGSARFTFGKRNIDQQQSAIVSEPPEGAAKELLLVSGFEVMYREA